MKKLLTTTAALALLAPIAAHTQSAPLIFTDTGVDLNVSNIYVWQFGTQTGPSVDQAAAITGLHLDATATGTASCINSAGKVIPAFSHIQIPQVTVSGSSGPPLPQSLSTQPPVNPIPGAPDCPPAPGWTEIITDLQFQSVSVVAFAGSITNHEWDCTFNPATTNGLVPDNKVSC